VYPPEFEYVRVHTVDEAVRRLSAEGAVALAGGQSLIPLLKLRLISPSLVVDLGGIRELRYVQYGDVVKIGALTRHYELEKSPCPLLRETARRIGDPQIRSLGTVGGSLAHADPLGDWPVAMLAVGASLIVEGPSGRREIEVDNFFKGPYSTALERGEVLTEVRLMCPPRAAFVKFSRRHNDFALVAVAVAAEVEEGHVKWIRIAASGVADRPIRLKKAEAVALGSRLSKDAVAEIAEVAAKEVEPPSDFRASSEYRRVLVKVGVKRALERL